MLKSLQKRLFSGLLAIAVVLPSAAQVIDRSSWGSVKVHVTPDYKVGNATWGQFFGSFLTKKNAVLLAGVAVVSYGLYKAREYWADYGHAELQGKRLTMEDVCDVRGEGNVRLYGLYDGHAGSRVSKYVASNLNKEILQQIRSGKGYEQAFSYSYRQININMYKALGKEVSRKQGTTAITALVDQTQILVANAGDSRAVLCNEGIAKLLSSDHKPTRKDEQKRIADVGGYMMNNHGLRVGGVLAVTRALGDLALISAGVTPIPEVVAYNRLRNDQFLILACDGVWDVFNNQDAVDVVRKGLDAGKSTKQAAQILVKAAYDKGSIDNISAIVVDLRKTNPK